MKKILPFFAFLFYISSNLFAQGKLIISEVADPADDYNGRFVELYNTGDATIDFGTDVYYLSKQTNGGTTWSDIALTGSIAPGTAYVIANQQAAFETDYGKSADLYSGDITGNGDDGYFLYKGGDHTTGTLSDAYGVIDEDGTGKPWEYLDSRAVRVPGTLDPNSTWTASEWTISSANVADFNPGVYSVTPVVDTNPPVWSTDYPKIRNIDDTSFTIAAKLDETSMIYYVVLDSSDTAPTVAEVLAGTGSSGAAAIVAGSFAGSTAESVDTVKGLTLGVTYDIYLVAEDDESTPNVQADTTVLEVTTATPPTVIVNAGFDSDLSPFTAVSVVGDQVWGQASFSGNGYAIMNGYSGGAQENEDWLISPAINLDASTDNVFSFSSSANYSGPDLVVLISTDFSGTYDSSSVVNANWTDITNLVALSSGSWTWTPSGDVDLSAYSGTAYVAFKYLSNPTDGAKTYEIDDVQLKGYLIPGSDASLSDLTVDGTTVTGFDPATTTYTIELPMGTTTVPTVAYTINDENATAMLTDATDLAGDNAARTTSVVVTAQDGTTTQTYTLLFNPVIEATSLSVVRNGDPSRTYMVTGKVLLTYQNSSRNQKYIQDATGGVMIDDPSGIITTTYGIGDSITGLKGKKTIYGGLVEFIPVQDPGAPVSSGNAVEPELITIDQFNNGLDTLESTLVKILGVTFEDAGTTFASKQNYNFTVNTEQGVLRTNYADLDYVTDATAIPEIADVTGIVIQYNGTAQIFPRAKTDFHVASSNANLASLSVNSTDIADFNAAVLTYNVALPAGTTNDQMPQITYTTANANATAEVTGPTDLFGDEAARTATIVVTAESGNTLTYNIVFTVTSTGISNNHIMSGLSLYPVPATDRLTISGLEGMKEFNIVNITGKVARKVLVTGDVMVLNISDLDKGIYFVHAESSTLKFIKE